MAQINFTLDYDFFVGLFSESKEAAFTKLMETMLNQILKAEPSEQLKAENQMEWVGWMNSIRSRAEEVVLSELVYC